MWYSAVGCVVNPTLSLLVAPRTAEAQQATNVHRIGRLASGSPPSRIHLWRLSGKGCARPRLYRGPEPRHRRPIRRG